MSKINRRAAVDTAKTMALIVLTLIVVLVCISFIPMSYIMIGFAVISFVALVRMVYDHYAWKYDREEFDKKYNS